MNRNALLRLLTLLATSLLLFSCGQPTTPSGPQTSTYFDVLGITGTRGSAVDLDIEGDSLFVAETSAGAGIYDASNLNQIVFTRRLLTNDRVEVVDAEPQLNALMVHANTINQLYFLDSLDAGQITPFGSDLVTDIISYVTRDSVASQWFDAPTVQADVIRAFVCDQTDGIQVITAYLDSSDFIVFGDTVNLFSVRNEFSLNWDGIRESAVCFLGDNNTIAVGLLDYGVAIANADVDSPQGTDRWLSDADTPGVVRGLACQDGYLYIADYGAGITILDVTDIYDPEFVTSWKLVNVDHIIAVAVNGDRLVAVDQYDGIFFLDISNPEQPEYKGTYPVREPTNVVFKDNELILISSISEGITALRLLF